MIDRPHLVVRPPLEGVDERTRVARVHVSPLHGHLARPEVLRLLGELERGEVGVHAIPPRLLQGRDDKLVERGVLRRFRLIPRAAELAHHPVLDPRTFLERRRLHQQLAVLLSRLRLDLLEPIFRRRVHHDPHAPGAEVQRDGAAELRRGARQEDLLDVRRDLLQDGRRGERVPVHHPYPQVGVLVHEQLTAAVQGFVFVQRAEADDLGTRRVRLQYGPLDLPVDVVELGLDEELESPSRGDPRRRVQVQEPVPVRGERLAEDSQQRDKRDAERQKGLQPPHALERLGAERSKRERQMEKREQLRAVRHEHHVRSLVRRSLAVDSLAVQLVAGRVVCPVRHVVNRHEEAEVHVHLGVVQGVVGRGVDEILHARDVHEPLGHELEVAVPDVVQQVEADEVRVEHRDGRAAKRPRPDEGDGEVGGVHDVLHEGMHGAGDGLGDERRVVVRVVPTVERVVVERPVQPIVDELGGPRVQQKELPHPHGVVLWEVVVAQVRHLVHQGHDDGLQDDVVVPVILPIDLLVVDPLRLNLRVLRHGVYPRERYPKLRVDVADGGDHEHVVRPVVGVVQAERGGRHERDEQEVLEAPHVLPRELIRGSRPERHVGLIRRRHVRAPAFSGPPAVEGGGACWTRRPDAGRPKARVPVVEVRSNTQGSGRAMCELLRAPIREGLDDRFGDGCVALPRVNLSHGVDIRALAAIDERDARRRSGRDCRECVRGEPARWLAAIRFLRRALRWARRRVLVRAVSGARIASLSTSIGAHRCHSLFIPAIRFVDVIFSLFLWSQDE